jgi:hypothetical protein
VKSCVSWVGGAGNLNVSALCGTTQLKKNRRVSVRCAVVGGGSCCNVDVALRWLCCVVFCCFFYSTQLLYWKIVSHRPWQCVKKNDPNERTPRRHTYVTFFLGGNVFFESARCGKQDGGAHEDLPGKWITLGMASLCSMPGCDGECAHEVFVRAARECQCANVPANLNNRAWEGGESVSIRACAGDDPQVQQHSLFSNGTDTARLRMVCVTHVARSLLL